MAFSGDYINGGDGDDCIVLDGPGNRIVLGGNGNDKTITVPAGTSDATIEDIFAHCHDPGYLAAQYGAGATAAAQPKQAATPLTSSADAQPQIPKARMAIEVDGEVIAMFLAVVVTLAVVTRRLVR